MDRVAVFGNAGAGKSTLARGLAEVTGLPLYAIDVMQHRGGVFTPGSRLPAEAYDISHAALLRQDRWIIEGFDSVSQAWARFDAADTLVYVDLPLMTHFFWVTKRLMKGLFRNPEGWPSNTPVWRSSLQAYRVLWLCHRHLTPRYREHVAAMAGLKRVYHLTSPAAIKAFLQTVRLEQRGH